jgi:hypothetical protein
MSDNPQNVRLRAFAGMVNKASEILVPVYISSKGEHDNHYVWVPISKTAAKELIEEAKERGLEEIEGVTESEGCLYLDGPGEEEGEPGTGEEEEEEEEEEEPEREAAEE